VTRRRRSFEIEVPEPAADAPEAGPARRRGPMASAIAGTAEAARARAEAEARIRAENDALAEAHVHLRGLGLVAELVALDAVRTTRLRRDRVAGPDPDLDELVASIRAVGLSNPIRVETAGPGQWELVQGWRRLAAYRRLWEETGAETWARIPALVMAPGESLADSYRRMVDENLVRRDVSFAEMALLARDYAADPAIPCRDADAAVAALYASAGAQKRSYIRAFVELMDMLDRHLAHPAAIPRNLGLAVRRQIGAGSPGLGDLVAALAARPGRSAAEELALLRGFAGGEVDPGPAPAAPPRARQPGGPRLRLSLERPEGPVQLTAAADRLEIRAPRDFAALDRARLERAVVALLAALEE